MMRMGSCRSLRCLFRQSSVLGMTTKDPVQTNLPPVGSCRHRLRLLSSSSSSSSAMPGKSELADDFFNRVLRRFPGNHSLSFAYGSGVFLQDGQETVRNNMTDFIIAVDDPVAWHRQNLQLNPKDYSGLVRMFGARLIAELQDKWAARLYFNTLIPFEDGLIKYGVISRDALVADLLDWESLYAAGRLHKPVRVLEKTPESKDPELHLSLRTNLTSALHTSLLLLPDKFHEAHLYMTIASLSYTGDFRMTVGEDKNKVVKIVRPMLPQFRALYANEINKMSEFLWYRSSTNEFEQDVGLAGRHFHLSMLPKKMQAHLVREWNRDKNWQDVEDVLRGAAGDRDSDEIITKCLQYIVAPKSLTQAAKGIVSAGPWKSVRYAGAKLNKMVQSYSKQIVDPLDPKKLS